MFVDASAIVAILANEPEADALALTLARAPVSITSPLAVFEATLGLCRGRRATVAAAQEQMQEFLHLTGIRLASITPEIAGLALDAFARFGKGRGHPARLNMGDCFAYAMARSHRTTLLFKGDDFSQTDIASAMP